MSSHSLVRIVIVAVLLVAGVCALYFWGAHREDTPPANPPSPSFSSPDPRLTFDTPYRNVRPDVAYVGDAACAGCHKDLCESFHRHPMGRSAAFWSDAERIEQFGANSHTNFAGPNGSPLFRVEQKDGHLWQTEELLDADGKTLAEVSADAAIVIGSGRQARSYICVRDGSLWQTGVSWYTARQRWDRSPGFGVGHHAQRPVTETCLFCHVDRAELVTGSEMRYREPLFSKQAHIGCERCHGPGALHVQERADGQALARPDTSIVNPRHLPPDLRDAVCQQCHLQGTHQVARRDRSVFEFRPGMPLEMFLAVFARTGSDPDRLKFVGHFEQMAASRCATASAGKMCCTSCHDPHVDPPPTEREQYFRQGCLKCHADRGCTLPIAERQAKNDACAACHMPRRATGDISHTAVTDHRILRRPSEKKSDRSSSREAELPIKFYHAASRFAPPPEEQERDLGIALSFLVRVNRAQGRHDPELASAAHSRLKNATDHFTTDAPAWEALAVVLSAEGKASDALAAAERALAIQPKREPSLHQAATLAMQLSDLNRAWEYSRRAVELNPGNSLSRLLYGLALVDRGEWEQAATELRTGLRGMPGNARARAGLAVALHYLGDDRAAKSELDRAIAFAPGQESSLREWFGRRVR